MKPVFNTLSFSVSVQFFHWVVSVFCAVLHFCALHESHSVLAAGAFLTLARLVTGTQLIRQSCAHVGADSVVYELWSTSPGALLPFLSTRFLEHPIHAIRTLPHRVFHMVLPSPTLAEISDGEGDQALLTCLQCTFIHKIFEESVVFRPFQYRCGSVRITCRIPRRDQQSPSPVLIGTHLCDALTLLPQERPVVEVEWTLCGSKYYALNAHY